jgi:SnoaL-like domain
MTDVFAEKDTVVARNEKVVRRFIDAWAAFDVEAAVACLAPNIVCINQPLGPVVGLVNVRKIIQGMRAESGLSLRSVLWQTLFAVALLSCLPSSLISRALRLMTGPNRGAA